MTVSASETCSQNKVGMSVASSIAQVTEIRASAQASQIGVVISCAFGSAHDVVGPNDVANIWADVVAAGVDAVTLADTTGVATPVRIERIIRVTGAAVGIHLQDTRGLALTNAYAAHGLGVRRFDTAVGGIGGSPFAAGAGGNLATEDLVLLFEDVGISTEVDLDKLIAISCWLGKTFGTGTPQPSGASGTATVIAMTGPGRRESLPCIVGAMAIRDAAVLGADKSGRRANRRGELLSIAAQLFAEHGFAGVTVDEIGAAAGVSGPSLYHHFDSKEALLGEMLVRISESLHARGEAIVENEPRGEHLTRLIQMHAEFAVDNPSLITVHMRDLVHARDEDGRQVRRLQAAYVDIWVAVIVGAKCDGADFDNRTARAMAHAVLGLINSTPFSSRLKRDAMIELLSGMARGSLDRFVHGPNKSAG